MNPRRIRWLLIGLVVSIAAAVAALRMDSGPAISTLDAVQETPHAAPETAGLCPWRNVDGDRMQFFPGSTGVQDETLLLSRYRAVVQRRLGHAPDAADNALLVHSVFRDRQRLGAIITRAVRGESGVIELVLAVDGEGRVVGAKLQRLREPDDVARALQSPAWLGAFRGKTAGSDWQPDQGFPALPPPARMSAAAVIEGARTALILLAVGRSPGGR